MTPTDFWSGVAAASLVALSLLVAALATGIIWLARWLSKFSAVHATKGEDGNVKATVEVRGS